MMAGVFGRACGHSGLGIPNSDLWAGECGNGDSLEKLGGGRTEARDVVALGLGFVSLGESLEFFGVEALSADKQRWRTSGSLCAP